MKLKNFASLLLAGVMSVSMLTACGSTVSEQPTQPEQPTTSSVVAAIQKGIDSHNPNLKVTVADSKMLDQRMDKIFDTASAHKDDNAMVAYAVADVFDIKKDDKNFSDSNSDFMNTANVLDTIASADDGKRKDDTIWAYTLIKVTNDNGNPYVTAGDKIGEAFAAAKLSNKFDDESQSDDVLANLSANYTLYVYGGQTMQPNNDVDTYVVAVLKASYSQVSA